MMITEYVKLGSTYLRARMHKRSLIIGLISLGVLLSFSVTVTYYQARLDRFGDEIASLRDSMETISAHQQHLMKRKKRSILDGRRTAGGSLGDSELVLGMNGGNGSRIMAAYGVAYTRWGRRDCRGRAEILYHGYTATTLYTQTGGGANYLCLHSNITYPQGGYQDGFQGASHIYGVEYRDSSSSWINSIIDADGTTEGGLVYLHTVPCAVCIARFRVTQVMIPGRDTCPDKWHMEYQGYIMAGATGDKHPSEFICVDKRPQVVPNTQGSQGSGHLHVVETQCASLVCEPYIAGREISCVVCSI